MLGDSVFTGLDRHVDRVVILYGVVVYKASLGEVEGKWNQLSRFRGSQGVKGLDLM